MLSVSDSTSPKAWALVELSSDKSMGRSHFAVCPVSETKVVILGGWTPKGSNSEVLMLDFDNDSAEITNQSKGSLGLICISKAT